MVTAMASGLGSVVVARALGPTVRGEYAAITAWFGISCIVGQMGLPAALCFYVAKDPQRARDYVATSRAMMLATGMLAFIAGLLLASVLSRGNPGVADGYRIAFGISIVTYVGIAYTYSLQPRHLLRWSVVRTIQPVLSLLILCILWFLKLLTLNTTLLILAATLTLQLGWGYWYCRRNALAPGHARFSLLRPLAVYGIAQIAALTPATLNAQLDQLVLSQTVAPADLGRYAIAVSLTSLPIPLVAAIGNVAFPRLAAQQVVTDATRRLQRQAIVTSAGIAAAMLVPLAVVAYWLIPFLFGAGYRGAVPLLWILTPGAIFLACGRSPVTCSGAGTIQLPSHGHKAWQPSLPLFCSLPSSRSSASTAPPSPQLSHTGPHWRPCSVRYGICHVTPAAQARLQRCRESRRRPPGLITHRVRP